MTPPSPTRTASIMLSWHSLELVSCTPLQTLWAGYGQICAVTARARTPEAAAHLAQLCGVAPSPATEGATYPLILKLISPPPGSSSDEGHLRKMLSYEVEQRFYATVAPALGTGVAVAGCVASTYERDVPELRGLIATLLVDLRGRYPVAGGKRSALSGVQVSAAVRWLAGMHARSWGLVPVGAGREELVRPPLEEVRRVTPGTGVWLNGGYTYLATRRREYAALAAETGSEWSCALCGVVEGFGMSVAEMVAVVLAPCGRAVESYIHGDVKSENLFTNETGDQVAFFDFQYVGLGLGVCDLAKLFTCSVPLRMLVGEEDVEEVLGMGDGERALLEEYRARLLEGKGSEMYDWDTFKRHWETALVDWCRFQASWGFWGNTEWLEARVRSILRDQGWRDWLYREVGSRNGAFCAQ
ncbi:phosphotransferase enzyme family protein [Aspergillus homomorphus CBS 101889]|uniref:Phosphotransferase enzyme family protein n=1 Tax=Aspergillus homomorphus (strain CBS 101889) TaxID=1450537 RepID=A0A395I239_ASPHC|nr:phosphotransferase enzyme family protein [Aspergillus homomorphus CBS 101889]RAL14120.1 phosphotransferase enzyme family protein [Aspergillus homomorphus CBS 101889]